MTSIRRYLTVALTAGIALLFGGAGWLVLEATRRALTHQFDEALATKAQALMAAAEEDDGELEIDFDVERLAGFHPEDASDVFEIRRADGRWTRSPWRSLLPSTRPGNRCASRRTAVASAWSLRWPRPRS